MSARNAMTGSLLKKYSFDEKVTSFELTHSTTSLQAVVGAQSGGKIFFNPDNDHYYEYVDEPISWEKAKVAASQLIHKGMRGHLITITSKGENDFATTMPTFVNKYGAMAGGYQGPDSREPGGGWKWATGEDCS